MKYELMGAWGTVGDRTKIRQFIADMPGAAPEGWDESPTVLVSLTGADAYDGYLDGLLTAWPPLLVSSKSRRLSERNYLVVLPRYVYEATCWLSKHEYGSWSANEGVYAYEDPYLMGLALERMWDPWVEDPEDVLQSLMDLQLALEERERSSSFPSASEVLAQLWADARAANGYVDGRDLLVEAAANLAQ